MSEKLAAKILLPNKKNKNSKRNGNGRSKRNRNGKDRPGRDLVAGGKQASSSLSRVTERWMPVFPASMTKTLRYSTNVSLGAAVGALSTWMFRANDLFDPDFSGTGHQPMGFDQLMAWYNHFCVVRARITCTFRNIGTASAAGAIRVDGSNTPLTVIDRLIEDGGLTMDTFESKGVTGSNKTLSLDVSIPRLQGVSRSALTADPTLRGDAATSPTEITYFHLCVWDSAGLATTSFVVDVVLEQTAVFMEPRDLIESFRLTSLQENKTCTSVRKR
jgi:hypothetical protein